MRLSLNPVSQPIPLSRNGYLLLLLAVTLLAAFIRLLALWSFSATPYFKIPVIDERIYHEWATRIANGTYTSTSVYQFAPLPAYVMAAVYRVFSPDIVYIQALNLLLGSATCLVIALLTRTLASRVAGLGAGLVAALYKPLIFYSIVPLKTALSVFLFATSLYALILTTKQPTWVKALSLGLVAGLTVTVRENVLPLVPAMLAMVLWSSHRNGEALPQLRKLFFCFLVGTTLATGPFLARNYLVAGELALTTHQAGFNLYLGNNLENPTPYYRPIPFAVPLPYDQQVQFRIEASRRAGRTLSASEASTYWVREVGILATAEPRAFLWKLGQKTLAVLNRFEAGDHYNIDFLSAFAAFFTLPFLTYGMLLPIGLAGMIITARASQASAFMSILFVLYASTLVLFYPNERYRLPLLAILIPFSVMGLAYLAALHRTQRVKTLALYASVLCLVGIVECLPLHGTKDLTAYYNLHGIVLDHQGLSEEAMSYWEVSSAMNQPFSAYANLALATKHLLHNEVAKARLDLTNIPDTSFAAASKYELLGDSYFAEGDILQAITAYDHALTINSGLLQVRQKLVALLFERDRERAIEEMKTLKELASLYSGL